MNTTLTTDRANAKLLGVCAGIGRAAGWSPFAVRLAAILALLVAGPVAVILYLLVGWIADAG